jgi:DNA invertase Pin-like site-specific DNA recombinase
MAAEPTRAIAYIRRNTPTDDDTVNRTNIEAQRITAYCGLNRITLIEMLIEEPGTRLGLDDRPALRACLAALSTGQADSLIVPNLRTLSRAIAELAPWLTRHFGESSPYELIAVQEQIDTRQPTGRLALGVLSALSLCDRGVRHA